VLSDPKGVIPGYDALLLVGPKASNDATLVALLRPLIGAVRVEDMRRANLMVDGQKMSPEAAAKWLDSALSKRP
jgi:osmoprotectant transport system permease protein